MTTKSKYVTIGSIKNSKEGDMYLELQNYEKDGKGQKTHMVIEKTAAKEYSAERFVIVPDESGSKIKARIYAPIGRIMEGANGSFMTLDGAKIVVNGEELNAELASLGDPSESAPDFVLNSVFVKKD